MSVHLLFLRVLDVKIRVIYRGRPANDEKVNFAVFQNRDLRRDNQHDVTLDRCPRAHTRPLRALRRREGSKMLILEVARFSNSPLLLN